MNGKAAKLLRKISELTGQDDHGLKDTWKKKSHIDRGKIRRGLAALSSKGEIQNVAR